MGQRQVLFSQWVFNALFLSALLFPGNVYSANQIFLQEDNALQFDFDNPMGKTTPSVGTKSQTDSKSPGKSGLAKSETGNDTSQTQNSDVALNEQTEIKIAEAPSKQVTLVSADRLQLSLQNVIERTLKNNVAIKVQEFQSNIRKENILTEKSAFDPTLSLEGRANENLQPVASAFAAPDVSNTERQNWKAGINQKLVTGTEYEINYTGFRDETNSAFAGLNPQYTSRVELNLTQPLLKNFGIDTNKKEIYIANNNLNISDFDFKTKVIDIITETENTYWDLVFSKEDLDVKKQSVERARDLERRVRIQVKVGTLAPIEILQAQSEVASREEAVLLAEKTIKDNEDKLKNILNIDFGSPEGLRDMVPLDSPLFRPGPEVDLGDSIKTALEKRPDFLARKKELDNKNIQVEFNENQLYPSLDLVGSFALNGLSGTAVPINAGAVTGTSRFGGNYGESLDQIGNGDFKNWEVGLVLSYPIGNRAAKSRLSASRLEAAQSLLGIKDLEKTIVVEVREAARKIKTDAKRVHAARIARKLAEEKLAAEEKKFGVGLSTSFNVLEFQTDLAAEQSKELKTIIDYNKSLNQFRKVKASTLDNYQIQLATNSTP